MGTREAEKRNTEEERARRVTAPWFVPASSIAEGPLAWAMSDSEKTRTREARPLESSKETGIGESN
jgi:hypothetical protein